MAALPATAKRLAAAALYLPDAEISEGLRIRLMLTRFVAAGFVVYFLVCLPEIATSSVLVAAWWTPVGVLLAFAPGWLLLAATFSRAWQPRSNVLVIACAVGYLAAVATWYLAWTGEAATGERATWLALFPGLPSLALVVSRWPWLSLPHLFVGSAMVMWANATGRNPEFGNTLPPADLFWNVMFSLGFVGAGLMAVRTADVLDATRDEVFHAAAAASASRAVDQERARYDALVHDRVLAVMLNASGAHPDPDVSTQAASLLAGLGDDPDPPPRRMGLPEMTAVLRQSVAEIAVSASVTGPPSEPRDQPFDLTVDTGRAIIDAALEAVRNSCRHAGDGAAVTVGVDVVDGRLLVTVGDDGRGFTVDAVRVDRIGIAVSIRRRIHDAGGRAHVESTPGAGTRVVIEWPRAS